SRSESRGFVPQIILGIEGKSFMKRNGFRFARDRLTRGSERAIVAARPVVKRSKSPCAGEWADEKDLPFNRDGPAVRHRNSRCKDRRSTISTTKPGARVERGGHQGVRPCLSGWDHGRLHERHLQARSQGCAGAGSGCP